MASANVAASVGGSSAGELQPALKPATAMLKSIRRVQKYPIDMSYPLAVWEA